MMTIEFDQDTLGQLADLQHHLDEISHPTEIPAQQVKAGIEHLLQNKEIYKAVSLLAAE